MKKRICLLLTILLAALCLFVGCEKGSGTPEGEQPGQQEQQTPQEQKSISEEIKSAYVAKYSHANAFTEADLTVDFYGEFDGTYVVEITGPWDYDIQMTELLIGGIYFNTPMCTVYRDGEFYSLRAAYDNDYLSQGNLFSVQQSHRARQNYLYREYDEITSKITSAYAEKHKIPENEVITPRYYGMFHDTDTYVVMISAKDVNFAAVVVNFTVDGVAFCFGSSWTFDVYHDGEFYSLPGAFDKGYLSHDDLVEVQKNHRGSFLYQQELDEQRENITREIVEVYLATRPALTAEDVILNFYGEYDIFDCYVIMISAESDSFTQAESELSVSGVHFHFPDGQQFTVYHKGEFCTLQEAYDRGYITYFYLKKTHMTHSAAHPELYREYDELTQEIIASYAELRGTSESEVGLNYFGIFENASVMLIRTADDDTFTNVVDTELVVDGVSFKFWYDWFFSVYHDGEFYSLQEAFDNGLLTHGELLMLQKNWTTY